MNRVIYTAVLGGSDTLKQAPVDCADRCYCYTDDPNWTGRDPKGWTFRPWVVIDSPRRDAWRIRCRPDLLFPTADQVLWLDASFSMLDIAALFSDAGAADLAGLHHHERRSCFQEGGELIEIGQSSSEDVYAQLGEYTRDGFGRWTPNGLTTSGVLLRRRTPGTLAFNRRWEFEIARYPGDNTQLSLDYSAWKVGLAITHLTGTYPDNPYVLYDGEDHHLHRRPYR